MATDFPDAPKVAKPPKSVDEKNNSKHLVIILEMASLETVKTKRVCLRARGGGVLPNCVL